MIKKKKIIILGKIILEHTSKSYALVRLGINITNFVYNSSSGPKGCCLLYIIKGVFTYVTYFLKHHNSCGFSHVLENCGAFHGKRYICYKFYIFIIGNRAQFYKWGGNT